MSALPQTDRSTENLIVWAECGSTEAQAVLLNRAVVDADLLAALWIDAYYGSLSLHTTHEWKAP